MYTLGEVLCSTLNLVTLTINFDSNIICIQYNVIGGFIHVIPIPIIRSYRDPINVQAIPKACLTGESLLPRQIKEVYQHG